MRSRMSLAKDIWHFDSVSSIGCIYYLLQLKPEKCLIKIWNIFFARSNTDIYIEIILSHRSSLIIWQYTSRQIFYPLVTPAVWSYLVYMWPLQRCCTLKVWVYRSCVRNTCDLRTQSKPLNTTSSWNQLNQVYSLNNWIVLVSWFTKSKEF